MSCDDDITLDMNIEIQDEEYSSSGSDESHSGIDDDDGEIGEFDVENGGAGDLEVAAAAADAPRAYQHEPEPRRPEAGDRDAPRRARIGPGGQNVDENRLDPRNLQNWCQCGCCQVHLLENLGEYVCCRSIPEVEDEAETNGVRCITEAGDFEAAILNPTVLYIGWLKYTEKWRRDAKNFGNRNNEKYRYVAYRQIVRWCWGILGKDIRVQLPACVLCKVRTTYPDRANVYRGTRLRRLDIIN